MRFIIFLFGILAGWFLKEVDWEKWLEKMQTSPSSAPQKKIEVKASSKKTDEVFSDPLEKIKGIGPAIKGKLNAGGVFTFAQLGALTPQELEEIVGASIRRITNEEEIINQAKKLAA
ncbi:MAG: hypothetical protein HN736_14320 [Anaerolineae bacterium]|jgi:predicted flap endonuclease-1-like 5' DNA nuclease|nr:hypothetical protein [Anaerolineae bacterium]MBT4308780.1 hypothetical protein [Anaerolineae bacterium]MBT4459999.1 hypothetical protein [Anaerolineae bacterium]MBT6061952.1 hypothetical protein [Anaerolineae bacterium]MBT6324015.1 hypothetical protein [Anaerolineae bacterium]